MKILYTLVEVPLWWLRWFKEYQINLTLATQSRMAARLLKQNYYIEFINFLFNSRLFYFHLKLGGGYGVFREYLWSRVGMESAWSRLTVGMKSAWSRHGEEIKEGFS